MPVELVQKLPTKLIQDEDRNNEQDGELAGRHQHLYSGRQADTTNDDQGHQCQPPSRTQGHRRLGGDELGGQKEEGRGSRGDGGRDHEQCGRHQQGPSGKESQADVEDLAHPGVRGARVRVVLIEVHVGQHDTHNQ